MALARYMGIASRLPISEAAEERALSAWGVLELASVMLTKLGRHFKCRVFIALCTASCSIINDQKSSAASPFYLI
jgi:hypothetical protein